MAELYVNVGGTWKTASNYYVNVNGTWKEGSELHAKVSSAWKESSGGYSGTSGIVSTNIVLDLNAGNSSSYSGSGTAWNDISGNSNNFTLTNGPTYTSSDGGAIVFDGSNDYAVSALNQSFFQFGTGDYSYGVWVKLDSLVNFASPISSGQASESGSWQIDGLLNNSNVFIFKHKLNASGTGLAFETSSSPNTNTWYYLFVVNDRSENELKFYVNGTLNTTSSDSNYGSTNVGNFSDATSTYNVLSVAQNRNQNVFLDASIAQVHVYKGKALTASEVLQNYNATKATFGY